MALESRVRADTLADRASIRIRELLYGRGHNQAELARALGKTAVWVSERLSGRVQLTVNDLELIADALGVEPEALLRVTRGYAIGEQPSTAPVPAPSFPRRPPARADQRRPAGAPPPTRGRTCPTGP